MAAKGKKSSQRPAALARGGGRDRMLGKGDRTQTASSDAAGPQHAGGTAHKTSRTGGKFAAGGEKVQHIGGLSRPAKAGQCGP
jgi:hypothetical protein